jgi:hypothetical protein
MEFLNNYLNNIRQTPEQYYHDYNQAVVNHRWDDTTQIRKVKEQIVTLNPFAWHNEFREYDAWVDTVSDLMVQYNKVYSDFIEILPQDVDHPQNYRGQYYKLALDNENEETYLCYDTINNLEQLPNFKLVRCNNVLTMINKDNKIVEYPCYLGVDISSTNDYVAKSGITPNSRMIVMVQVNDDTKQIVNNQRFMFEHGSTFEVEEINNFMQEEGTNGAVTIMRLYVKYSPYLPRDNKELNLCDYWGTEIKPEEPITKKTLIVEPINYNIKQGRTKDIVYKVVNEDGSVISQAVTYTVDWSDDRYYTIENIDNGVKIKNVKMADNPLLITFKSDGCEDITVKIYLISKI